MWYAAGRRGRGAVAMGRQIQLDQRARAVEHKDGAVHEVRADVAYQRLGIVNVAYCGFAGAGAGRWYLIDAGIPGMARMIRSAAERRFGPGPPAALVLTHGHFDHVGSLRRLLGEWDVPVFAHRSEFPFLTGQTPYPPTHPGAGGGLMSWMAAFYPRGPIDISPWLTPLPDDGTIPGMPNWRWIHTPGHARAHLAVA